VATRRQIELFIALARAGKGAPLELHLAIAELLEADAPKPRGRPKGSTKAARHTVIRAAAAFLEPHGIKPASDKGRAWLSLFNGRYTLTASAVRRICKPPCLLLFTPEMRSDEKGPFLAIVLEERPAGESELWAIRIRDKDQIAALLDAVNGKFN
jgi:hypothetical protein